MGTDGGVRALLVFGSNLAVSAPRAGHIEERLEALDFLVVSDFFLSETAERADVVLPSAQWAEEEGTMTNLEGRVLLRQRAMPPPDRRADRHSRSISALAARLGVRPGFPVGAAESFRRTARAPRPAAWPITPASRTSGSRAKTASSGPVPTEDHPGTPRLFLDRFAHADGRARFHAVESRPPPKSPTTNFRCT